MERVYVKFGDIWHYVEKQTNACTLLKTAHMSADSEGNYCLFSSQI